MIDNKRESCSECIMFDDCCLNHYHKMYKKVCYVDTVAKKIKRKSDFVVNELATLQKTYCDDISFAIKNITDENDWIFLSKKEKMAAAYDYLMHWVKLNKKAVPAYEVPDVKKNERYTKFLVAVVDSCLGSWRNEPYVRCLRCGEVVKNNSRRNKKYCSLCSGYKRKEYIERICPNCGRLFAVKTPNNRQYRCMECQNQVNKVSHRERAKRYREKKRDAINSKE